MPFEPTPVTSEQLKEVSSQFEIQGDFASGATYGSGHINDTFAVTMKQEGKRREGSRQNRRHEKKSRTPAQRLIDSGDLKKAERMKLQS